ncbi:MAG: hypothetical protein ACOC1G_00145 [Phycisphaeraceae bacterium]
MKRPLPVRGVDVSRSAMLGLLALLSFASMAAAEGRTIDDFDSLPLGRSWSAAGEVRVSSSEPPDAPLRSQAGAFRPSGNAALVRSQGVSALYRKQPIPGVDWSRYRTLRFWVLRTREQLEQPMTIEVQVRPTGDRARKWRKVELNFEKPGWHRIELPLVWFRHSRERVVRWSQCDQLFFFHRGAGEFWIDGIELVPGEGETPAVVDAEDLADVAFPDADPPALRVHRRAGLLLMTDNAAVDLEVVADRIVELQQRLADALPFNEQTEPPATLLIFDREEDYRSFPPRLGERLGAAAPEPTSDGYTLWGIATAVYDEQLGNDRPTFVHEAVHSILVRRLGLYSKGDWLHEGIASYLQLQYHPQQNFPKLVQQGLSSPRFRTALPELLNGQRISLQRYWQAATVCEMLLDNPAYRRQLPALVKAMQQAGTTDLGPHLETILDTDWEAFERRWQNFARQRYGEGQAQGG